MQLEKLITPVLHLDRQNRVPFLRNVAVTLPILSAAKNWIVGDFQWPKYIKYSENDSEITFETQVFSLWSQNHRRESDESFRRG